MKEKNIIPIAHRFVWPVCLFFTGMNLTMPYKISIIIKPKMAMNNDSNGTIVLSELLSKIEINTQTTDPAMQAHIVCPPIGIFANVRFIACSISTARTLYFDANKTI